MDSSNKREKVIKGLGCCLNGCDDECPYWTSPSGSASICMSEMKKDALALLKAQEPRVMTISDFKDEGVYYLEALPPFVLRPVIYRLDHSDPRHYNFVWKYDQFTWNTDEYGKTWRCWTSRPTYEQREATPWQV